MNRYVIILVILFLAIVGYLCISFLTMKAIYDVHVRLIVGQQLPFAAKIESGGSNRVLNGIEYATIKDGSLVLNSFPDQRKIFFRVAATYDERGVPIPIPNPHRSSDDRVRGYRGLITNSKREYFVVFGNAEEMRNLSRSVASR